MVSLAVKGLIHIKQYDDHNRPVARKQKYFD